MDEATAAIYVAAASGSIEQLRECVRDEADMLRKNVEGDTALHLAIRNTDLRATQTLIEIGIPLNIRNRSKETPLFLASASGALNVAKALLEAGANPTLGIDEFHSCLYVAVKQRHAGMVQLLLTAALSVSAIWQAMQMALVLDDQAVIDAFLNSGYGLTIRDPDSGATILHTMAYLNRRGTGKLLKAGVDINALDTIDATPLHYAARQGSLRMVRTLLRRGANVDPVDKKYGGTPLGAAILANEWPIVKVLLRAGADPHRMVPPGRSYLHLAAQKESVKILTALLSRRLKPNICDENGATAAIWAAQNGNMESLKALHDFGCDLLKPDQNHRTPLHLAGLGGFTPIIDYLLDLGAPIDGMDSDGNACLEAALQEGHDSVVEFLINRGALPSMERLSRALNLDNSRIVEKLLSTGSYTDTLKTETGKLFLEQQISRGRPHLMRLLILAGAEISALDLIEQNQVMILAAEKGFMDVMSSVLSVNSCRTAHNETTLLTPVHLAALHGHDEMLQLLIDEGFDPRSETQYGQTSLHLAALEGRLPVVQMLQCIISPMLKDVNGNVALHWAANNGHHEVVTILTKWVPDVNPINNVRRTPLHLACLEGHSAVVQTLLDAGANPHAPDLKLMRPLHLVCQSQSSEALCIVLAHTKSDINNTDVLGNTPLILAAVYGSLEMVKVLVEAGADTSGVGSHGLSALDAASRHGEADIFGYLLKTDRSWEHKPRRMAKTWLEAFRGGNHKILSILTASKSSLNGIEKDAIISMLAETALAGDDEVFSRMLYHIPSVIELNSDIGSRLLVLASNKGCLEAVQILLKLHNIRKCSYNGYTPLHAAAKSGHRGVVEALLHSGADAKALDPKSGKTPLELAQEREDNLAVQTFLDYFEFERAVERCNANAKLLASPVKGKEL